MAIVRLTGAQAIRLVNDVFEGTDLTLREGYTLHHGRMVADSQVVDEVLIGLFRAPHSYTGEDVVEISCHGSPYIIEQLLRLLTSRGARLAGPGEFTLRAFLNGKMDLSQAEAVGDLIAASSASQHQAAMTQLRGGFSSRIRQLRDELIRFASLVELELDFSEEDVEFADRQQLLDLISTMRKQIQDLIFSFELGNVVKHGVVTVIAGRPNAGKSTLLNALLKEERAIVSDIPGTTRDTIEEVLHISGIPFRLIDTAGLRDAADRIEMLGVERTLEKLKTGTVILYVFDASRVSVSEALRDTEGMQGKVILVANKSDLNPAFSATPDVVAVSAKTQANLDELQRVLLAAVIGDIRALQNPVVTSQRHEQALRRTEASLAKVEAAISRRVGGELLSLELRTALDALGEITGQVTSEDLLETIFSTFCIGK